MSQCLSHILPFFKPRLRTAGYNEAPDAFVPRQFTVPSVADLSLRQRIGFLAGTGYVKHLADDGYDENFRLSEDNIPILSGWLKGAIPLPEAAR